MCPIFIVSDIRLESIYMIVGSSNLIARGSKLIRQFLSDVSRLLELSLSRLSRVLNKLKNNARCPVHYIGFRVRTFLFRSIRDNGSDSSHRTLPALSEVMVVGECDDADADINATDTRRMDAPILNKTLNGRIPLKGLGRNTVGTCR